MADDCKVSSIVSGSSKAIPSVRKVTSTEEFLCRKLRLVVPGVKEKSPLNMLTPGAALEYL